MPKIVDSNLPSTRLSKPLIYIVQIFYILSLLFMIFFKN